MTSDWVEKKIDEIAEVIGGGTPSTKDESNFGGDIAWITPKDLSGYSSRHISRGERNITEKGLRDSSARILPKGSVLLTTRAPVGYLAISANPVTTNQGFHSLVPKTGYDAEFIYYLLKANVETLKSHSTGTTFGELTGSVLRQLRFSFPAYEEQRAIAHTLGTLDDKIELNRKMNETLEAIARALFKSWFVDFDPVRAKAEGRQPAGMDAETAALFPDAFENSELREVPKGWRAGTLAEIADNPRRGVSPEEVASETPYIGLEHMPRKSIALTDWGRAGETISNKFHFRQGEILFGKLRPYFHKVGIAPVDGVCSTDILTIHPKSDEWYSSVLCLVSSDEFVNHAVTFSDGTKMPRTNWQDMARYDVVIPTREVIMMFNHRVLPMIQEIRASIMQSRTLAALRDALLPKMISGEVRVKGAEKFVFGK